MKMIEMDANVTLRDQLNEEAGPVIVINQFTVAPGDAEALVDAWSQDAAYFKSQPGFISAQLHRGVAGSSVFINYAVWESVGRFREAFGNPEFHAKLAHYPDSTVAAPHLFTKMAVPGICVA